MAGFRGCVEWDGRRLNALHGEVFVHGPMVLVGSVLARDETSYLGPRPSLRPMRHEWLPSVLRANGSAMRTLWLMHELRPAPRSVNTTARWRES